MNTHTIIVTWNQTDLTLECLAALERAGVALADVWVVDNGSQPEAHTAVTERFPAVRVLRLEDNRGFAGGCNAGAQAALHAGADALFLLNNDALVEPETLPALAGALDADMGLAAVAPKVYYATEGRIIQSVGLRVDPDSGQARMIGSAEPDRGQHDRPADREALFGCAMLIRRAAWETAGPFWEPFFSYAEETDWCLRARAVGWRLGYVPASIVWHRTSSTLGWDSPLKVYLTARNQLFLRRRHTRGGWRAARGLAYAAYVSGRTWLHFMRKRQRRQARALELAWWDYTHGHAGDRRGPDLRQRTQ
jgi:GT2 family glycosyltransferase